MKKKTGFILGISAVCLLGLGTQVKAASEIGANFTGHHYSDWHEAHHQQMQERRTSNSYQNETMSVSSAASENTEATDTEGAVSCPQGHEWCNGDHQGWTDGIPAADAEAVPSCPQGHAWCDGNHQGRSSAQGQNHHNEEGPQNNNHQNSGRHHSGHH